MVISKNLLLDCGCPSLTIFHVAHLGNCPLFALTGTFQSTAQVPCSWIYLGKSVATCCWFVDVPLMWAIRFDHGDEDGEDGSNDGGGGYCKYPLMTDMLLWTHHVYHSQYHPCMHVQSGQRHLPKPTLIPVTDSAISPFCGTCWLHSNILPSKLAAF